ncbi:hypothetical protein, partial [Proteus mirabilis]|uniref:hypothetical protein n=1 Tax=Proteus mirabilis TaxID=584 RepID=UPI003F687346
YSTSATRDVAELILKDSGHLQEKDAEYTNRKGFSKHKPALALYGIRDAERSLELFSSVRFDEPTRLPGNATLTFRHTPFPHPDLRVHMESMAKRIGFPQQAIAHD